MKFEVLGTGCYKCIQLETLINEILAGLGKSGINVIRSSDESYIRKFMPLDEIPGLLIDGRLVCAGIVPDRDTLYEWLK